MTNQRTTFWRPGAQLLAVALLAGALFACHRPLDPAQLAGEKAMETSEPLLIDDFETDRGASALGTNWRRFTDQVMGGISTASHGWASVDGRGVMRLTGEVSLENNGGFVQVALPLAEGDRPVDMSAYRGIRLIVKGNGEGGYYVHLRTTACWLPWQYYQAPLDATSSWQTVEIPWVAFAPESLSADFDPARLKRIAVVAAQREMSADIMIDRIELYH